MPLSFFLISTASTSSFFCNCPAGLEFISKPVRTSTGQVARKDGIPLGSATTGSLAASAFLPAGLLSSSSSSSVQPECSDESEEDSESESESWGRAAGFARAGGAAFLEAAGAAAGSSSSSSSSESSESAIASSSVSPLPAFSDTQPSSRPLNRMRVVPLSLTLDSRHSTSSALFSWPCGLLFISNPARTSTPCGSTTL